MKKRIGCFLLACLLLTGLCPPSGILAEEASAGGSSQGTVSAPEGSYAAYDARYAAVEAGKEPVEAQPAPGTAMRTLEGKACAVSGEEEPLSFTVTLPAEGRYRIVVEYYALEGSINAVERGLLINGASPFSEAEILSFSRMYKDADPYDGGFTYDKQGNELRPTQEEVFGFQECALTGGGSYYDEPFSFYFPAEESTVTFTYIREDFAISRLTLEPEESIPSYAQVQEAYEAAGYTEAAGDAPIKVQAENSYRKSSPSLYPISDRMSAASEPFDPYHILLNTIGSSNWKNNGDWISWQITVPESGLYRIALRERQNLVSGSFVTRRLTIDGELPFAEAANLQFVYDPSWKVEVLGGEDGAYTFYFEAGKTYELRLEAALGDLAEILRDVEESIQNLNLVYRQILVITGASPDPYRDYQLETELAGGLQTLRDEAARLHGVLDRIHAVSNLGGSFTSSIEKMLVRIEAMAEKPKKIPKTFTDFKNCIIGLSSWLYTAAQQTLELDYIALLPGEAEIPRANAGFFESLSANFSLFLSSFVSDYSTMGSGEEGSEVTAWVGTGRDQATIISRLCETEFTQETGIHVDLKLVSVGSLLPAVLAGQGPDVYLTAAVTDPMNYALRGAVRDLAEFSDFSSVASRFTESALTPYTYEGHVYALPETQTFPVLFYRTDILSELGLEVPETWDDVIDMLGVLQRNNMSFALPAYASSSTVLDMTSFATFLYQNGGDFFTEDKTAAAVDSEEGVEAFEQYLNYYTAYSLPHTYDFVTRFRMGEFPIGIADYSVYNTLSVSAPEIAGLWKIAVVPGTRQEDGSVDHTAASTGTCTMMLSSAKDPEAAWSFLKWWSEADTQVSYGRELETVMGVGARYAAANIEALGRMAWSKEELATLTAQRDWTVGIPEVPGGYLKEREISFAVREVILEGANPRESLLDHVKRINEEITKKRKEFGLN